MDANTLEKVYQENLEERLISYISEKRNISYEEAMSIYYKSDLSKKIYEGENDIQYLDYKVLADILIETEKELFLDL